MEVLLWEIGETAHALRRAFDRRAATLGITRAQWRVLAHLERRPGQRQVDLADRLDVEPITLCRIVDRLEEAGLVERRRDPDDRRAWQLHLRETAGPLLGKLHAMADQLSDEVFAGISAQESGTTRDVLTRLRANVAALREMKASA